MGFLNLNHSPIFQTMIERNTFIPFGENKDHSIDYLLGILEDARVTTLQVTNNISTEELHWQYAEGWNTISCLLSHLISCSHYFRVEVIEGRHLNDEEKKEIMPGLRMGDFIPELITNQPYIDYVNQLEDSKVKLFKAIKKLSIEDFHKRREGYNPNTGHNLAWTLYHQAEDEVHHRGQMTMIRKLYRKHN